MFILRNGHVVILDLRVEIPSLAPPEGVTQSVRVGEGRKAWRTSILRTFRLLCVFIAF